MKKLQWMLVFSLACLALFSCKNNDNDNDVQPPPREENEFLITMNKMNARIDSLALSGHADEDFALVMVRHHQAAIDLANLELQKGDDDGMKSIAQKILNTKTAEKDSMTLWLVGRNPTRNATGERFDSVMTATFEKYRNLDAVNITGDADKDFAEVMTIHNKTTAEVGQSIVQLGHHDDMKAWARQMAVDATQWNIDLQTWLTANKNQ
jgi:uncharacterized protein (DUF305 family)